MIAQTKQADGILFTDSLVKLYSMPNMMSKVAEQNSTEQVIQFNVLNSVYRWSHIFRRESRVLIQHIGKVVEQIVMDKTVIEQLSVICLTDPYTYTHSVDVAILAIAMGATMDFDNTMLLHLGMGCLFHDLGKIDISKAVLNKPDSLEGNELQEMQKHPVYGYKRIRKMGLHSLCADIVLNHHERYDGSGYPNGLSAKQIAMPTYVCAVADVYSAMTADRVYRKALPQHKAYRTILAGRGRDFDSIAVDGFRRCIKPSKGR